MSRVVLLSARFRDNDGPTPGRSERSVWFSDPKDKGVCSGFSERETFFERIVKETVDDVLFAICFEDYLESRFPWLEVSDRDSVLCREFFPGVTGRFDLDRLSRASGSHELLILDVLGLNFVGVGAREVDVAFLEGWLSDGGRRDGFFCAASSGCGDG